MAQLRSRHRKSRGAESKWAAHALVIATGLSLAACATNLGSDGGPGQLNATASIAGSPGSATGSPAPNKTKTTKIALLLPLAGFDQTAAIAKGMKQAAEMALFEADRPGIQLIVKDDKGSVEGAKVAAEEAIKDGAEIILGPVFGRSVGGAAPVARQHNVPILAFSNDRTVAGNGVYLMSFLAEQEVDRIVSFAASKDKKRFAALIPDDAYGKAVEPAFREAVARAGGSVAHLEIYPAGANAMLTPAKRIFEAIKQAESEGVPIDALFVPGGQDVLPQLGPLIAYSGIDTAKVRLLGTGAWEFANIGSYDAFVGGWYPGPDPQGWREFSSRFVKNFGSAPPRLASLAYDAVGVAITVATNEFGQRFTNANLTRPNGFGGVDGQIRFGANGVVERGLAVLEVQKIGSTMVDPAPGVTGATKLSAAGDGRVN